MPLPPPPNLLFIFLKAFVTTGGIEKVNRVLLLILHQMHLSGKIRIQAASPYSKGAMPQYFPESLLLGFQGDRWRFMLHMLLRPPKTDILLVGHINLAPAVALLRWRYPRLRVVLIAHGIEVWRPLSGFKKRLVQQAERIISVSAYTRQKLIELHGVAPERIQVLPNCLDPYFKLPQSFEKPAYLLDRYGIRPGEKVLLTISRLSAHEGYKGYDRVLEALPAVLAQQPHTRYILAGRYDASEKQRLDAIIREKNIGAQVILTGFVPDEELSDHYLLADAFVMPSKKEGFGIVFIEAMACGTPAIGGDQDGSPEALRPGELGHCVNPDDLAALSRTIISVLGQPRHPAELQQKTVARFGFEPYRQRFETLVLEED